MATTTTTSNTGSTTSNDPIPVAPPSGAGSSSALQSRRVVAANKVPVYVPVAKAGTLSGLSLVGSLGSVALSIVTAAQRTANPTAMGAALATLTTTAAGTPVASASTATVAAGDFLRIDPRLVSGVFDLTWSIN